MAAHRPRTGFVRRSELVASRAYSWWTERDAFGLITCGQRMICKSKSRTCWPNHTVQRKEASRFAQKPIDRQGRLASVADLCVSCDMKLQSVLLGWSNPDQALRVSAGTPRKHAPDGRWPSGRYCPGVWSLPGNVANLAASSRGMR